MKQRHGCLTAWLILMLIANAAAALLYLFGSSMIRQRTPFMPEWIFAALIVLGVFNVICTIALFQWKKWGFWGFCGSSIVAVFVNVQAGSGAATSVLGLVGLAILYGVLQIGNENKGWPQLK